MIEWTDEQLQEAGVDKRKLKALVNRLNQVKDYLDSMELTLFIAPGEMCVIHSYAESHTDSGGLDPDAVIATVQTDKVDGGDW